MLETSSEQTRMRLLTAHENIRFPRKSSIAVIKTRTFSSKFYNDGMFGVRFKLKDFSTEDKVPIEKDVQFPLKRQNDATGDRIKILIP